MGCEPSGWVFPVLALAGNGGGTAPEADTGNGGGPPAKATPLGGNGGGIGPVYGLMGADSAAGASGWMGGGNGERPGSV